VTTMSTGVQQLDSLLGGLRLGDNVVWDIDGPKEDAFVAAFLRASAGAPLVYVSFDASPKAVLDRLGPDWDRERFLLIDCFTQARRRGDSAVGSFSRGPGAQRMRVQRVEAPTAPRAVHELLEEIELRLGRGARYVFDSLTGIQQLWGPDEALSLFLRSCPRLYDLRTVAYWFLHRPAHTGAFLTRLRHVTQVVLELSEVDGRASIRVAKAHGRPPDVSGREARVTFHDGRVRLVQQPAPPGPAVGELIRSHRVARGLAQAELARRIGISPSALSQIERGVSGLSPATLERAREALDLPLGTAPAARPYRLRPRSGRQVRRIAPGMAAEELADTPGHQLLLIRVDPGAGGRRVPFNTKREEVVVVLRGVLEVRVGEAREVLHAGDAILLSDEPVGSWRNPGPEEAEALWAVLTAP
jgi:transcriptional regulator with XRE-family HTH domain/KaiC/GvpD/RAD55 family RecA-like ATPase